MGPNNSTPQSNSTGAARYVPIWARLLDALNLVMAATGLSKGEAQRDICRAIADGAIRFRAQLKQRATSSTRSSSVLDGSAFEVSPVIVPTDLDWESSGPLKAWVVSRGAYKVPGYWYLAWIELRVDDITKAFCSSPDELAPSAPGEPQMMARPGRPAVKPRKKGSAVQKRRRGPPPKRLNAAKRAMMEDIQQARLTVEELDGMLEKNLKAEYRVSRDTARKARNEVLSQLKSQTSTNSRKRQIATKKKRPR